MKFQNVDFTMLGKNEKKKLNWKHIVATVTVVVIIIISIYLMINIQKKNREAKKGDNIIQQEETNLGQTEEIKVQDEIKKQEQAKLPIYSEVALEAIKNIYKSDEKRVFLTFDDGPSNTVTPTILDVLKENNVKATFFVLGSRVELYPELLKREYDEGHYIANHGYSHKYQDIYAAVTNVLDEYNKTEECIRNALGTTEYSSHLFRFPGGLPGGKYANIKKEAATVLEENQIAHVDWNALTKDAEGSFNKEQLLNNLYSTTQGKNSVVLLMHDAGNKASTAEALPDVIAYFRDGGYEFKNFYDIMK
mgnify:CR=1 FL=1